MIHSLENAFPLHCRNDIDTIKNYLVLEDMDACRIITLNQSIFHIPYRIYNEPLTMVQLESFTHHQQLKISFINQKKIYPLLTICTE